MKNKHLDPQPIHLSLCTEFLIPRPGALLSIMVDGQVRWMGECTGREEFIVGGRQYAPGTSCLPSQADDLHVEVLAIRDCSLGVVLDCRELSASAP